MLNLKAVLAQFKTQFKEKWKNKKDRRQILAFIGAGVFLVISFWTSFEDRRLKQDIASAKVVEKFESGRAFIPFASDSASIVILQFDETGKITNLESESSIRQQVEDVLAQSSFTAMKRNDLPRSAKVPVSIPLMKEEKQPPAKNAGPEGKIEPGE